jgi:hypothetical protein
MEEPFAGYAGVVNADWQARHHRDAPVPVKTRPLCDDLPPVQHSIYGCVLSVDFSQNTTLSLRYQYDSSLEQEHLLRSGPLYFGGKVQRQQHASLMTCYLSLSVCSS